ncbi:MAG: T9SS type A sorting domain-containing protein [Lentimicrobium sp.]|nr:T9SS type A sorting domain-containing protein [Lentimicrobium sp.]
MKNKPILFLCFLISLSAGAQITVTSDDMPLIGDTLRISITANLQGVDPSLTGPGYIWDYTQLQPDNQTVERYLNVNTTPIFYQFIFNQNVANLAYPIDAIGFLPGVELTDAYMFYKKNSGNYLRPGYAVTMMGLPLPMKFDQPELLYSFPLTSTSTKDSSISNYSLGLPNVGYLSIERKRINEVNGWGSLTTPFGTFEVLRVKSTIFERDSIYIDSIQTGLPIIRNYIEYQWLGKGQGIPLLTITVEGQFTVASYKDFVQSSGTLSIIAEDKTICQGDTATLTVFAIGGTPPYNYLWSTGAQTSTITVSPDETEAYSVLVIDAQNEVANGNLTVTVLPFNRLYLGADTLVCAGNSISFNAGGMYDQVKWYFDDALVSHETFVTLDTSLVNSNNVKVRVEYTHGPCVGFDEVNVQFLNCQGINMNYIRKLSIFPNPAKDILIVEFQDLNETAEVTIFDINGQMLENRTVKSEKDHLIINTSGLKSGNYFIRIKSNKDTGSAIFTIP